MLRLHRPWGALLVLLLAVAGVAARQQSQITVLADNAQVVVHDSTADAKFRVKVSNGGAAALANVRGRFADGTEVYVGDVDASATAVSDVVALTLNVGDTPTHNLPVPVTLTYVVDGSPVTQDAVVIVGLP